MTQWLFIGKKYKITPLMYGRSPHNPLNYLFVQFTPTTVNWPNLPINDFFVRGFKFYRIFLKIYVDFFVIISSMIFYPKD